LIQGGFGHLESRPKKEAARLVRAVRRRRRGHTHYTAVQSCGIVALRLARKMALGQISNFRVGRVHVRTGYNPGEGIRRASRNGLVSDLPPEFPTRLRFARTFASLYMRGGVRAFHKSRDPVPPVQPVVSQSLCCPQVLDGQTWSMWESQWRGLHVAEPDDGDGELAVERRGSG
jgi:hypothetical protein